MESSTRTASRTKRNDDIGRINDDNGSRGRRSFGVGGAFPDDSFRSYMSRKIDLQRKQFGLVLPPDPREKRQQSSPQCKDEARDSTKKAKWRRREEQSFRSESSHEEAEATSPLSPSSPQRCPGNNLSNILYRLKRRHGTGSSDGKRKRCERTRSRQSEDAGEFQCATEPCKESPRRQSSITQTSQKTVSTPLTPIRKRRPGLFFTGIVILVNGYTNPDAITLMRLLHKHGGDLEKYETPRVTHIIAEHLSTAKANIYKRQRKPTPICRPEWIVDSIAAGRLLPHAHYLIDEVRNESVGSKTVERFFKTPRKIPSSSTSVSNSLHNQRAKHSLPVENTESPQKENGKPKEGTLRVKNQSSKAIPRASQKDDIYTQPNSQKQELLFVTDERGENDNFQREGNSGTAEFATSTAGIFQTSEINATIQCDSRNESSTEKYADCSDNLLQHETLEHDTNPEGGKSHIEIPEVALGSEGAPLCLSKDASLTTNVPTSTPIQNSQSEVLPAEFADPNEENDDTGITDSSQGTSYISKGPVLSNRSDNGEETSSVASERDTVNERKRRAEIITVVGEEMPAPTTVSETSTTVVGTVSIQNDKTRVDEMIDGAESLSNTCFEIEKKQTYAPSKKTTQMSDGTIRTVGTDPNFLESFFHNSRLSFIGSFKQRVKKSHNNDAAVRRKLDKTSERFVFHVDMDCFFAAVVLRNYPQYKDKPVVIAHSGQSTHHGQDVSLVSSDVPNSATRKGINNMSTSECSTCNYVARTYGIQKGMYLGRAKELCPDLIVLQYDFEGYEEVSEQVAEILYRHSEPYNGTVEQVSCDEAYVQMFFSGEDSIDAKQEIARMVAERIRSDIFSSTRCTASVGVGPNKILAKLATDRVKPDGTCVVKQRESFMDGLELRDLPGIGYMMEKKLKTEGLVTVKDVWELRDKAENELCRILGPGTGKKIMLFCQGKDDRSVQTAERKTVGAECNYGVRFDGPYGVDHMMAGLAKEVQRRMEGVSVYGRRLTLKIKKRKEGAKPPPKFLGHGSCHNLSKSCDIPGTAATRDRSIMTQIGMKLFEELGVHKDDVRGMGIVMSKLESSVGREHGSSGANMSAWLQGGERDAEVIKSRQCRTSLSTNDGGTTEMKQIHARQNDNPRKPSEPLCRERESFLKSKSHVSKQRNVRFSPDTQEQEASHTTLGCSREIDINSVIMTSPAARSDTTSPSSSKSDGTDDNVDFLIPNLSQLDREVVSNLPRRFKRAVERRLNFDSTCAGALGSSGKTVGMQISCHERLERSSDHDDFHDSGVEVKDRHTFESVCVPRGERFLHHTESVEFDIGSEPSSFIRRGQSEENISLAQEELSTTELAGEDLCLPPVDQIDMDEVMSLPSSLRKVVLRKIETIRDTDVENQSDDTLSPLMSQTLINSLPPKPKSKKTILRNHNKRDGDSELGRFRQVSVKRMLKLASVKCGKYKLEDSFEGEPISLTQLDCLPLEMQLQVANNDEVCIGKLNSSASGGRRSAVKREIDDDCARAGHEKLSCTRHYSPEEKSSSPCIAQSAADEQKHLEAAARTEDNDNFYEENLLPLRNWMDSFPEPESTDVETVTGFFRICVSEARLDDVVIMLRMIKNRRDKWSGEPYSSILKAVDDELVQKEGRRLDTEWLGLA